MVSDAERRARFEAVAASVYEPLQRYLGRRATADDASALLNDTLLVMWRRLDDVPIDDPIPWSYGVAKRCLANHRRGENRRLRLVGKITAHAQTTDSFDGPSMSAHDNPGLTAALGELDEADRELIRLWAWEQLEPREIAVALETTSNAVSVRLARAKKKIENALARQNDAIGGHEAPGHREELR